MNLTTWRSSVTFYENILIMKRAQSHTVLNWQLMGKKTEGMSIDSSGSIVMPERKKNSLAEEALGS